MENHSRRFCGWQVWRRRFSIFHLPFSIALFLLPFSIATAQPFTHADSLHGGNGPGRRCYDVLHYAIHIEPDIAAQTLQGYVEMRFRWRGRTVNSRDTLLQIDADSALAIDSIVHIGHGKLRYRREANVAWVKIARPMGHVLGGGNSHFRPRYSAGVQMLAARSFYHTFRIYYHGRPLAARNPPWGDGAIVWARDSLGRPFVGTACQEYGAQAWWPCKDDLADRPDSGTSLEALIPDTLTLVSNGVLQVDSLIIIPPSPPRRKGWGGTKRFMRWATRYPITPYNVTMNIGKFVATRDSVSAIYTPGKQISIALWLLDYQARRGAAYLMPKTKQLLSTLADINAMDYPWADEGYKLCQAPYWGMEHQTCIAYGDKFRLNPFGIDFILVHESGHEWWGNYLTAADHADDWLHEGFDTYQEALYVERTQGQPAAERYYRQAIAPRIRNVNPLVRPYGVACTANPYNEIYFRAAELLHTLHQSVGDSAFMACWRAILRSHDGRPTSTKAVLQVIAQLLTPAHAAFAAFALHTTASAIPHVEPLPKGGFKYRIPNLPPKAQITLPIIHNGKTYRVTPTADWQVMEQ